MSETPVYPNRARAMRERLLALRPDAPQKVTLDGEDYYVRTPLLSDRDRIRAMAMPSGLKQEDVEAGNIPIDRMVAAACIVLVCDETGAPVFETADFDAIRAAPIGSVLERLGTIALAKLNPKVPPGEVQGGRAEQGSSTSSPTA
jgi:hypothetical protein